MMERKKHNVVVSITFYFFVLIVVSISSIAFWAQSRTAQIAIPIRFAYLITEYASIATALFTLTGTMLGVIVSFSLKKLLKTTAKQRLAQSRGATVSEIQVWNLLATKGQLFCRKRLSVSAFTVVVWAVGAALTAAFTTLIRPVPITVNAILSGSELDMMHPDFTNWYSAKYPNGSLINAKAREDCYWVEYNNISFPSCAPLDDAMTLISAGIANAQWFSVTSDTYTFIQYGDMAYVKSTIGTIAYGIKGLQAFSDVLGSPFARYYETVGYVYKLRQQGMSAEVKCNTTSKSMITANLLRSLPTDSRTWLNQSEYLFSLNGTTSPQRYSQVVSDKGSAAVFLDPDNSPPSKLQTMYFEAFGKYVDKKINFPAMQCTIQPFMMNVSVVYDSDRGYFDATPDFSGQDNKTRPGEYPLNNTVVAIKHVLSLSNGIWGNTILDSLYTILCQQHLSLGYAINDTTYLKVMEHFIVGVMQAQGTFQRMYFTAVNHNAPRRQVNGTFTTDRLGYRGDISRIVPIGVLLTLILCFASVYVYLGITTGVYRVSPFDPVDSTCLITAATIGGARGVLTLNGKGATDFNAKETYETRVKYDDIQGLQHAEYQHLGMEMHDTTYKAPTVGILERKPSDDSVENEARFMNRNY